MTRLPADIPFVFWLGVGLLTLDHHRRREQKLERCINKLDGSTRSRLCASFRTVSLMSLRRSVRNNGHVSEECGYFAEEGEDLLALGYFRGMEKQKFPDGSGHIDHVGFELVTILERGRNSQVMIDDDSHIT